MSLLNQVESLSFAQKKTFLNELFVQYEKPQLVGLLTSLTKEQLAQLVFLLFSHEEDKKQLIIQQIEQESITTSEYIKQLAQQVFQLHYKIKELAEQQDDSQDILQLESAM